MIKVSVGLPMYGDTLELANSARGDVPLEQWLTDAAASALNAQPECEQDPFAVVDSGTGWHERGEFCVREFQVQMERDNDVSNDVLIRWAQFAVVRAAGERDEDWVDMRSDDDEAISIAWVYAPGMPTPRLPTDAELKDWIGD